MKYVWESGGVKRWKANRPQLAYPLHSTPKICWWTFSAFLITFSCWALRFEFQQNSRMATTIAMASPHSRTTNTPPVVVFKRESKQTGKTGRRSGKATNRRQSKRERARQTDNRSLIKHTVWLDDAAKAACCVWDNNRIYKKHVCKRRSKAKKRERFLFFSKKILRK